jgi:hypothetical protein
MKSGQALPGASSLPVQAGQTNVEDELPDINELQIE